MRAYICTFALLALFGVACNSQKEPASGTPSSGQVAAASKNDTVRIANDSLEYEVIIIEPGFNTWLASHARPRGYYAQPYLENKNRFWVTEWNVRANQPERYRDMYQMRIDYDPKINYGYEVNYLLFNYLVYFQQTTGQKLGGIVPQF